MGTPITTIAGGICFAFPDVCWTPVPIIVEVPIPYPNIGELSQASPTFSDVLVKGSAIVHEDSEISTTTGDEAGANGGVANGRQITKEVKFTSYSSSVLVHGKKVVRMFDATTQNKENAVGIVLGGEPSVLVGG